MIKLAGVLFTENGTKEDALTCKDLLSKAMILEPNNAEATLLQGKVYHKLGEWQNAIDALELAIKIQAEDPN